jgi:hypothetical protein
MKIYIEASRDTSASIVLNVGSGQERFSNAIRDLRDVARMAIDDPA